MLALVLGCLAIIGESRRVQSPLHLQSGEENEQANKHDPSAQSFVEVSQRVHSSFAPPGAAARSSALQPTAPRSIPVASSGENVGQHGVARATLPDMSAPKLDNTLEVRSESDRVSMATPDLKQENHEELKTVSSRSSLEDGLNHELVELLKNLGIATIMSYTLIAPQEAMAAAADWYPLAGRTGSLVHPIVMFSLLLTSLYSGYLGLQWRNLRTIGDRIKNVQAQAPVLSTGKAKFPLGDRITEVKGEHEKAEDEATRAKLESDLKLLAGAATLDAQYVELVDTRDTLKKANLKDKHQTTGSVLLGVGVTVAVLGTFNTYMRAGKLFPGPHLYAGMAIVICWALAAAVTPAMQKGNDLARNVHIGLNMINVSLFSWQLFTGWQITMKVLEKTNWP